MIQAKLQKLQSGAVIRPHAHRNKIIVNCLVKGVIQESKLDPFKRGTLSVTYHSAPNILVRSGYDIHTLKASVDSTLLGVSASWPASHKSFPALVVLVNALGVFSSGVEACIHSELNPETMIEHRMGKHEDSCFLEVLEEKAQSGDIEAQITLGISYMEGLAGVEDPITGLYWLRRAAEKEEGKGFYEAYVTDAEEGYVC